ncbi:MAG: HAD family hydrolase [Planctomycetes bacterium]|nr:HAD family hydrolase [Planctomycetota bacterium]
MKQRIEGILFDLGDTLLDFVPPNIQRKFLQGAKQTYQYLRSLGQPMPLFASYHIRQFWAIRWRYMLSLITGREFNSLDVLVKLGKRMGHRLTREQSLELSWLWYEPLGRSATVEDGTREMLRDFRGAGLKLGLISNTFIPGEVLDRHLEQVGLLDLLSVRVYSSSFGRRKPDRRIFDHTLSCMGLQAARTLFVGDSLKADVRGARRAGLISVLKDPSNKHAGSRIRPHHRIAALRELNDVVASYNGS